MAYTLTTCNSLPSIYIELAFCSKIKFIRLIFFQIIWFSCVFIVFKLCFAIFLRAFILFFSIFLIWVVAPFLAILSFFFNPPTLFITISFNVILLLAKFIEFCVHVLLWSIFLWTRMVENDVYWGLFVLRFEFVHRNTTSFWPYILF